MDTYFPTLGGYIKKPELICDQLLVALFSSDYSQSNAFLGSVSSFQYIVHAAGDNFAAMGTMIETTVDELFKRYFESASSTVMVVPIEEGSSKYTIRLSVVVVDSSGSRYDLQASIHAVDGQAVKILTGDRMLWSNNIVG